MLETDLMNVDQQKGESCAATHAIEALFDARF